MKSKDFITENFINNFNIDLYDYNYIVLDRLCKKIDVVKEIKISYKDDLSKATSNKSISIDTYIKLLDLLILNVEKEKDLKYLNSSLKLLDKIKNDIPTEKLDEIENKVNTFFKELL